VTADTQYDPFLLVHVFQPFIQRAADSPSGVGANFFVRLAESERVSRLTSSGVRKPR